MSNNSPTAIILVIGNEILSGRTQDKNLHWMAGQLGEIGIKLIEARVIPDIESVIVQNVQYASQTADYVFTSGGIGPTHDDITTASVAKAFGVPVIKHPDAVKALESYYAADQLNEARLRMAHVPETATLVPNPISAAPGFIIKNVVVMAGVPSILQVMFNHVKMSLRHGEKYVSESLRVWTGEGNIADVMQLLQTQWEQVDIGSYPFVQQGRVGTSVVVRGVDAAAIHSVIKLLSDLLTEKQIPFEVE